MYIIDGHLDLAWNAIQWNRDLRQSVYTIRTQERNPGIAIPGKALGTVSLPEMRQGRIAICFSTLLARSTGSVSPHIDFQSAAQAYGVARGQLAYYMALQTLGEIRIIRDNQILENHIEEWERWDNGGELDQYQQHPLIGFVISMESADPILQSNDLQEWWNAGVRIIGPAHYGLGRYTGGTGTEYGFNEEGFKLLKEMEQYRMILDLSHLTDKAFWQAIDRFSGNIIASHNNCRKIVPNQRQFDDTQIKSIIGRDGVIGVVLDASMLQVGWCVGQSTNESISLSNVAEHIDHICQLAGNCKHAAIGSDLDGGFGLEQSPNDIDTITDLQKLKNLLTTKGYSLNNIEDILHGNWLRILRKSWT